MLSHERGLVSLVLDASTSNHRRLGHQAFPLCVFLSPCPVAVLVNCHSQLLDCLRRSSIRAVLSVVSLCSLTDSFRFGFLALPSFKRHEKDDFHRLFFVGFSSLLAAHERWCWFSWRHGTKFARSVTRFDWLTLVWRHSLGYFAERRDEGDSVEQRFPSSPKNRSLNFFSESWRLAKNRHASWRLA